MKNFVIIIVFLFISCKESNNSVTVYSWEEYIEAETKTPNKKIIVVDTICPYEIRRAENDILKNKLVYFCRNSTDEVIEELNLLTKEYNIKAIYRSSSCIPPPKGFTQYCYENLMNIEIEKRHGKNWIDSLNTVALKNYVLKHPDEPYIEYGIDLRTKYLK